MHHQPTVLKWNTVLTTACHVNTAALACHTFISKFGLYCSNARGVLWIKQVVHASLGALVFLTTSPKHDTVNQFHRAFYQGVLCAWGAVPALWLLLGTPGFLQHTSFTNIESVCKSMWRSFTRKGCLWDWADGAASRRNVGRNLCLET